MSSEVENLIYVIEVKDNASDAFKSHKRDIDAAAKAAEEMGRTWKTAGETIKTSLWSAFKGIDSFGAGMERFVKYGADIDKHIVSAFKGLISVIGDVGKALVHLAFNVAKQAFETIISLAKKMAEVVWEGIKDSVKAYAAFEEQLGGARKTMGLTAEESKALGNRLREMALDFSDTGLSAGVAHKDLAAIAELAGQMNISFADSPKDFETFIKTVAMATSAFKMGAEETATALGQIRNNYKLTMDELPALAGAIDIVGNASLANESAIMQFMTKVGAMAEKAGMTTTQMIALGGVFGDMGVPMEVAGTAMYQTFVMLRTELDKFAEVLGPGGISKEMLETAVRSGDMSGALMLVAQGLSKIGETDTLAAEQALKDLGFEGIRTLGAFNALLAGQEKYVNYQAMIADPLNNTRSLLESYRASLDTMNARFKQAGVLVNELQMIIGEKLANAIANVMEKHIIPLLAKFQEWLKNSPAAQAILTEIGRTIEIIGEAIGKLVMGWITWLDSLDETTAQKEIQEWFAKIQSAIENLITNFANIDWGAVWNDLVRILGDVFGLLAETTTAWKDMGRWVEDVGMIWSEFWSESEKDWNDFKRWLQDIKVVWDEFWNLAVEPAFMSVNDQITAVNHLFNIFGDTAVAAIQKVGESLLGLAKNAIQGAIDGIKRLGEIAFQHSVFPDMADWAGVAADAVNSIGMATQTVTQAMVMTGEAAKGMTTEMVAGAASQIEAWGKVREHIQNAYQLASSSPSITVNDEALAMYQRQQAQQIYGENVGSYIAAEGNAARIARQSQVQQQQAPVSNRTGDLLTVNFNGANLVDEQSVRNFAAQITRVQAETRTTRI
jgi:TP901 family phage tail tape measure protein